MARAIATGALITCTGWVRKNNEDACLFGRTFSLTSMKTPLEAQCRGNNGWVIAVADGVGGHNAGERASHEVVSTLATCSKFTIKEIADVLVKLDRQLITMGQKDARFAGMGSVVAGILCGSQGVTVFNVGDSRGYVYQKDKFVQITEDDTMARLLDKNGFGKEADLRAAKLTVITQCIGGKMEVTPFAPHFHQIPITQPTRFILCSDGLSDAIAVADMPGLAAPPIPCTKAVSNLLTAAKDAETQDNVSIVVVDVSI